MDGSTNQKTMIIMRGVPASGKSTRAKELAGDTGLVLSTDDFWYLIDPNRPGEYVFKKKFLAQAHKWNRVRAQNAINEGHPLIIIDNTNTTAKEFCCYARYAHWQDYTVKIEEPTSPWWLEIHDLLHRKRDNSDTLKEWARKLEKKSEGIHDVPFFAIERMFWRWENDLDIDRVISTCIQDHSNIVEAPHEDGAESSDGDVGSLPDHPR